MLFRDLLCRRKLDVAAQFAFALKHLEFVRERGTRTKFQRNVLCIREDPAKGLLGAEQDAAVLHFLGDGRIQTKDYFPQSLHKLEALRIEKAYVIE